MCGCEAEFGQRVLSPRKVGDIGQQEQQNKQFQHKVSSAFKGDASVVSPMGSLNMVGRTHADFQAADVAQPALGL